MIIGFIVIIGLISCSAVVLTETTSTNQNVKDDIKITYTKQLGKKQSQEKGLELY